MNIQKVLNDNQGIISIVGLFIVIPASIFSEKLISFFRGRTHRKELKSILIRELWININFIANVNKSFVNQLNDINNLHIPHYPPRTNVLGKFFEFNLLNNLDINERDGLIEIYQQLEDMKYEFYLWRTKIQSCEAIDVKWYEIYSSTLLSYVKPLMTNMLEMWITLVKNIGSKSKIPQIKEVNSVIIKLISQGKWIRIAYKSSEFNKECYNNIEKFDVIICWENDWKECSKVVIEIKNTIALYESWMY